MSFLVKSEVSLVQSPIPVLSRDRPIIDGTIIFDDDILSVEKNDETPLSRVVGTWDSAVIIAGFVVLLSLSLVVWALAISFTFEGRDYARWRNSNWDEFESFIQGRRGVSNVNKSAYLAEPWSIPASLRRSFEGEEPPAAAPTAENAGQAAIWNGFALLVTVAIIVVGAALL